MHPLEIKMNRIKKSIAQTLLIASLVVYPVWGFAQETQPVMPKIEETPLPPAITLEAPNTPIPKDIPNKPLTAEEAVRIALHHQPSIFSAIGNIHAAEGATMQARSNLYPLLSVSAGASQSGVLASEGKYQLSTGGSLSATATIRQLLFDFNHTRDTVAEAEQNEKATKANLTVAENNLAYQVKQAFYTYMQDERLVAVNQSNVASLQQHLAETKAQLNAGVGLLSDVTNAEAAVSSAILSLSQAENNASVAKVNLALLLGIDPRTPLNIATETGESAMNALDVSTLVKTALQRRPEILSAQANLNAAKLALDAAKTSNAPSISAEMSANAVSNNFPPGNDTWTIGASVSWNPFDSGYTYGRIKQAEGNLQSAVAQLESQKLSVVSDVSQAYLNLKTAEQSVETAKIEVANAEENLKLADGRYRSGVGIFLEVTDAQTSLLTAQTNLVNARTAVDLARSALSHAIGESVQALLK
jgi:outer membrane protein